MRAGMTGALSAAVWRTCWQAGTPQRAKLVERQRYILSGLRMPIDSQDIRRGKFIAANLTAPGVPENWDSMKTDLRIEFHKASMEAQLRQLRQLFLLAVALDRTVIMPRMVCYCDRYWGPVEEYATTPHSPKQRFLLCFRWTSRVKTGHFSMHTAPRVSNTTNGLCVSGAKCRVRLRPAFHSPAPWTTSSSRFTWTTTQPHLVSQ
eukprot:scaffold7118_cov30-Prasinocladus_malaysianus.AAC.1